MRPRGTVLAAVVSLSLSGAAHAGEGTARGGLDPRARAVHHVRYAALGDSCAVGVGAQEGGYPDRLARRLRAERRDVAFINFATSGATSAEVARHQMARAIASRPSVITLAIGVNDLVRGASPERFAHDFERLAKALSTSGAVVLVANLPDVSYAPMAAGLPVEMIRARVRAYNDGIAEIGARYGLRVVDLFTESRELLPGRPDLFSADGFHPSDAGYEAWATWMWPAFREAALAGAAAPAVRALPSPGGPARDGHGAS